MPAGLELIERAMRRVAGYSPQPIPNIFFLHLPKCGGTSISAAIQARFPGHWRQTALAHEASACAARVAGRDVLAFRRDLPLYALSRQQDGCITGHYPFS